MKNHDTYKAPITIEFPNMIARIHIPELTADERNRRMQAVKKAAANLLKGVTKNETSQEPNRN